MNGWIRLWTVVSSIWILGIVFNIVIAMPDKPSDVSVFYGLDENTKLYFDGLLENPPQKIPSYAVGITSESGREVSISHLFMKDSELPDFKNDVEITLVKYGKDESMIFSEKSMSDFIDQTISQNVLAGEALISYENEVENQINRLNVEWLRHIKEKLVLLIVLPLMVFLLGYSIAWIRRGFLSH